MINFGTVSPGTTLYIPFDSFAGSTGASITLTGLAVTDIEVYKNGSITQRSSDTGYTLLDTDGIDFDGLTGIHGFSIDLSSNADAGFYAAGADYFVVVSSVTVDTQTVSFVAARFRIGYAGAILDTTIASLSSQTSFTLTAGPAEDDALNGREIVIHDVASAVQVGSAVVLDYTGSTKTVTLAAGTTFTAAATDNVSVLGRAPLQPATAGSTLTVTSGRANADVTHWNASTTPVTNFTTVYSTDFAANYNTTLDQWSVNVESWNATAVPAEHTAGYPISTIKDGTGTGEINTNAGAIAVVDLTTTTTTAANVTTVSSGAISEASFATTAGSFAPLQVIDQGTAQSATGTTLVLRSAAAFADDEPNGARILITGGSTGVGQSRLITDYVSTTDTATVAAWTTTPTGTITYKIFSSVAAATGTAPSASEVADEVQTRTIAGVTLVGTATNVTTVNGLAANVITAASIAPAAIDAATFAADVDAENLSYIITDATRLNGANVNTLTSHDPGSTIASAVALGTVNTSVNNLTTLTAAVSGEVDKVPKSDSNVTWNATAAAQIQSEAAGALNAYDPPTHAELTAAIAALNNLSAAQVNAEVVDVLSVDTFAELAADPGASPTVVKALMLLYMALRNKVDVTATAKEIHNNAGTVLVTKTLSDDGTTYSETKVA